MSANQEDESVLMVMDEKDCLMTGTVLYYTATSHYAFLGARDD